MMKAELAALWAGAPSWATRGAGQCADAGRVRCGPVRQAAETGPRGKNEGERAGLIRLG